MARPSDASVRTRPNEDKDKHFFVFQPDPYGGKVVFNNLAFAKDRGCLDRNKIGTVVSLIRGELDFEFLEGMQVEHHQVPIDDDDQANMLVYLDRTYRLVRDRMLAGINVLVHCVSCVSRAPAFAVAFVARYLREERRVTWPLAQSSEHNPFLFVYRQSALSAASHNNFIVQLALYWGKLFGCRDSVIAMRKWLESKLVDNYARQRNEDKDYVRLCTKMIIDSGPVIYGDHRSSIKCQKCRTVVVASKDVIYLDDLHCFSVSVLSDFVRPHLPRPFGQGSIECAKCSHKLGHYNWDVPAQHKDEIFFPRTFDWKFEVSYTSIFHLNLNRIDFDPKLRHLFLTNLIPSIGSNSNK